MNTRVRDVMTPVPLVVVGPDDDLARAGQTMTWTRVRHVPVMENGALVGILSERDFIRGLAGQGAGPAPTVRSAMHAPVTWIGPDEPLASALSLMLSRKIGCLPVMSSRGLEGMLTTTDLLRQQLYTAFDRAVAPEQEGSHR
jgi:CBS domain-containing protein